MLLQILHIRNLVYRKYFRALHLLCTLLACARVTDTHKIPHRAEMCTHSTAWETSGRHSSCSLDEKSKILFVSSFFLQFTSWFALFEILHLSCTQILRTKTLFITQMKGFFSGDRAQVMVELREKIY